MFPAAIWALHAVDLAGEGLQGGLNTGVDWHYGGGIAVGHSLVLVELWRRRAGVVIMSACKQVIHSRHGRSWWTGRTWGSRLSWWALLI